MKQFLLSVFLYGFVTAISAQQPYWQQQLHYTIRVILNDSSHTLDGSVKISYKNNSPDTLHHLWFQLRPNAFSSDKTILSEQLLRDGDMDFYFSSPEQKGYINQLDFRINDVHAHTLEHPEHPDLIRVILPSPLLPGESILISTPFHVKIPGAFFQFGHHGQSYQLVNWYPAPVVYDKQGWHLEPLLKQGGTYNEAGDFEVSISLPENYVVAAPGFLYNEAEKEWMKHRSAFHDEETTHRGKLKAGHYKTIRNNTPVSSAIFKTLRYRLRNASDFSWFADKRFIVNQDTCALSSGKIVDVYSFYTPDEKFAWANSIELIKNVLKFFDSTIGEYSYPTLSVAQAPPKMGSTHPGIIALSLVRSKALSRAQLVQSIGANWFNYGMYVNLPEHPWISNGLNTYYTNRYLIHENIKPPPVFSSKRLNHLLFETRAAVKKDQPVNLPATSFNPVNYKLSTYTKAAQWMQLIESSLGKPAFDSLIRSFFEQWKHKHPYPDDFKRTINSIAFNHSDSIFSLLNKKGSLTTPVAKSLRLVWPAKTDPYQRYYYVGVSPVIGFNDYDKLMAGAAIHNYTLPPSRLRYAGAALYAFGSRQLNGIGTITYDWFPEKRLHKIETGLSFARFAEDRYTDDEKNTTYLRYRKITPRARLTFKNNDAQSTVHRYVQLKTHFMKTESLRFSWDSIALKNKYATVSENRTIHELQLVTENNRALYPYDYTLQFDLSNDFGRLSFTGNYFFNYPQKGGLNVRWFAGKFFYTGEQTPMKRFTSESYQLNLSTPKGYEDYTYSNYFIGRSAYQGLLSQQVMMRDGGFKARTDLLSNKVGKTDNWLMALNFTSTIHPRLPVKLFADLGTYQDGWDRDTHQPKILFDGGVQLRLFKNILNVYIPLVYSRVYRDYYRSIPGNNFWQRISFSIDIQQIKCENLKSFLLSNCL